MPITQKKKIYFIVFFIFLAAFIAANFSYPKYWNEKADWLNAKKNEVQYIKKLSNIPQMPDISFKLGLDLQGGIHLIYDADLSNTEEKNRDQAMAGLRDVIERRVNFFGVKEPLVQVQGARLVVELAGIIDPAEAVRQIGQTPYLEFKEQREDYQQILESNSKVLEAKEGQFQDPFQSTPLTGKYLQKAELGFNQTTSQPLVLLQFNDEGTKIFEDLTSQNIGKQVAIYIDGLPISAPVVQEKISGGKAQISGQFTLEEAKDLVRNLNAGALPVPIKLVSQQTVGPTLGKISLDESLKAGILGFIAIFVFMIIFYRVPGVLASLSLLIYVVFLLTLFKLIPVTLTLAGIAGFILSMGMAVDANILIFARFREELKTGKSYLAALEEGSKRAWPAIRDGNFTTILVGLILFGFGTSFVKGFAFTLIIGNLVGMFTAIFITGYFLKCFTGTIFERVKLLWR